MKYCSSLLFFYFGAILSLFAQENKRSIFIGAEVQWYPAGWLIGPSALFNLRPRHVILFKIGANIADRHNWSGLNDNEKGTGVGLSLGYRFLFKPAQHTIYLGTRGELYNTKINWKNFPPIGPATLGSTRILVYQPSIELGYLAFTKNKAWQFNFSGAVGAEVNLITRGKPVGQGGMWLVQCSVYRKVK